MSKYLLISGSPRKGNTDFILSKVYDSIKEEKELILLRNHDIKHCKGCLVCHDKPECVIKDDMDKIRDKILNSNVLIVGTPNYFGNITGLMKDFVDRLHPFYKAESLKNKKLILIMVGGGEIEGLKKYLNETMYGFVKYLKLDLIGSYCFKGLYFNDVKQNLDSDKEINKIIEKIKEISL